MRIKVKIPAGVKEGDSFTVRLSQSHAVSVKCPKGYSGKQYLEIDIPDVPEEQKLEAKKMLQQAGPGSGFATFYPLYIDANKSISQGRRVPLNCACQHPENGIIQMALNALKLRFVTEPRKRHPRDFMRHGRIRVQFKTAEGKPIVESITNRRQLFMEVGRRILAMPQYQNWVTRIKEQQAAALAAATAPPPAPAQKKPTQRAQHTSTKKKKRNRKKKKK